MLKSVTRLSVAILLAALLVAGFCLVLAAGASPVNAAEPVAQASVDQKLGVIIFDGDSLTAGSEATDPYPSQVMRQMPNSICWYNLGIGGLRIRDILEMAPTRVDRRYNARLGRNVVVVWAGTNDLALWNHQPAAVFSRIKQYCLDRRAQGFKVLVLTMLPRCDKICTPGFEERRDGVNRRIRVNWPDFADGLVDVATDARIGMPGCEKDLQYWVKGGVHLTNKGLGVVANYVRQGLSQLEMAGTAYVTAGY
jgi:lysophospholipase L1-like esterase